MRKLELCVGMALMFLGAVGSAHAAAFKPCDDAGSNPALKGSLCKVERVVADPSGQAGAPAGNVDRVDLFVRKFPASGAARGQVWLIAGGPGESGAAFYGLVPVFQAAFPGLDLIVPDHRGTGFSTRMCPKEEAPASPGGAALDGAEWGSCFAYLNGQPGVTRQFSQTNAAHDLKLLLERTPAKGKTYLYGVSYGTQLVLRTLAIGAKGVDGVVLDSLVSLQDDDKADLSRRSLIADAIGRRRLADCDADPACSARMGEPAETVYRRVLAKVAQDPALAATIPGKNLKRLFGNLLDVPSVAEQLPYVIKDLDEGRPEPFKAVLAEAEKEMARLGSFPQSPPSMPLVILISGSENNLRPGRTAKDVADEEAGLLFTSSLPGHLVNTPFPLYKPDAWYARLPARLPPTLVIHGDRDAKTDYDAAVRHVAALGKAGPVRLYTARNEAHWVLWSGRSCAGREVAAFVGAKLTSTAGPACVEAAGAR